MNNGRKFSTMRRISCSSLSSVLSTRSSCSTSCTSPFTKWEYEWTSKIRLVTNPVTGRRTSSPLPPELPWVTGKEFTLTPLKDRNCEMQEGQNFLCKRRTGEAIPRAAKFVRNNNSWAQSLNWEMWIGNQSPIRYRGTKFGSLKIRDEAKLLKADMESFLGIWHSSVKLTMEILKSLSRHIILQKDLRLLNRCTLNGGEVPCITVAGDQSTFKKLLETTKTYRSKINRIAE